MTWISSTTWTELSLLGVAFLLCGAIGLERQISQKSAGLRTHTLVGMGSAGFTLVSAYGFSSVLGDDVLLDPSRIAAQIVSGVGFLGAGVIFMRRDVVRGLTTAASIWLTAAVGMACGAGMIVMAGAMTILHLIAIVILAPISKHLPSRDNRRTLIIRYRGGLGSLRGVLSVASDMGFQTVIRSTKQVGGDTDKPTVLAQMQFHGRPPLQLLMTEFAEVPGVEAVSFGNQDHEWDE